MKTIVLMMLMAGPPPTWVMATRECKPCDNRLLEEQLTPPETKNCGRARGPDAGVELLMTKCFKWARAYGPAKIRFDAVGEEAVDFTYVGYPDGGVDVITESRNEVCEGEVATGICGALPEHPSTALGCPGAQLVPVCSEGGTMHWTLSKKKPMKDSASAGVLYAPPDAGSLVCEQHLRGLYCFGAKEWDAGR